mmetsp:Transcript_30278/g.76713  ORF Transcript_30278/g.76713 Transcript_30278/m.76713 type:complete len:83 (+) Transcript_30278:2-250(+)
MLTFSSGSGLGMGTSSWKDCAKKYKRVEGGKKVCADGNAEDNWDPIPPGGWGYYDTGFADPVPCPAKGFCPRPVGESKQGYF